MYPSLNLRVIVGHAPQETDPVEKRQEFYEELSVQIERCLTSGDELIVLGDLNVRIGIENCAVVPLNQSPNGKELSEIIQKHSLKVANFHQNCTGKWTRIQNCRDGTRKKSVLDYILLQKHLFDELVEVQIDEEKIYCPIQGYG